jgi:hypothetical protein
LYITEAEVEAGKGLDDLDPWVDQDKLEDPALELPPGVTLDTLYKNAGMERYGDACQVQQAQVAYPQGLSAIAESQSTLDMLYKNAGMERYGDVHQVQQAQVAHPQGLSAIAASQSSLPHPGTQPFFGAGSYVDGMNGFLPPMEADGVDALQADANTWTHAAQFPPFVVPQATPVTPARSSAIGSGINYEAWIHSGAFVAPQEDEGEDLFAGTEPSVSMDGDGVSADSTGDTNYSNGISTVRRSAHTAKKYSHTSTGNGAGGKKLSKEACE